MASSSHQHLLSRIARESRGLLIYGLGSIARSVLAFLLLPLYLKFFPPEQYGILSITMVAMMFTQLVITAGLMSALQRLYFGTQGVARRELVGTTIIWYFLVSAVVLSVAAIFARNISLALFKSADYSLMVRLVAFDLPASILIDVPYNLLRLEKRALAYILLSFLQLGIDLFLKLLFIVKLRWGLTGYYAADLLNLSTVLLVSLILTRRYYSISFRLHHLRGLLRLGIPFILSGFAVWSLTAVDRVILKLFYGDGAVGIYAAGAKFAQIFVVFMHQPFNFFLPPILLSYYENHKNSQTKDLLSYVMQLLLVAGGLVYVCTCIGTKALLPILVHSLGSDANYLKSLTIVPILTLPPFLYTLTSSAGYALLFVKKPELNTLACMVSAVANVGFNFLFIPRFGTVGAAAATACSYAMYLVLVYVITARQFPIRHDWRIYLTVIGSLALVMAVGWNVEISNPLLNLAAAILLSAVFYLLLVLLGSGLFAKNARLKLLDRLASLR